jgi:hypothetical protein
MLFVLAQRAASEGPRWTRAVESIPVALALDEQQITSIGPMQRHTLVVR